MKIGRDTTGDLVNRIVAHPEVRPWVLADDQELDFRLLAKDPRVLMLVGEPPVGSIIFVRIVAGVYEAHAASLPQGRGHWMYEMSLDAIRYMFTSTDCIEILTRVMHNYPAAHALARQLEFTERWQCPAFRFRGKDVSYSVWGLTMMEWFPADADQRELILREMYHAGQEQKAKAWHARWAHLSRNVVST